MGLLLLGMMVGLTSAIACFFAGGISFLDAFAIYWIMGVVTPILHVIILPDLDAFTA